MKKQYDTPKALIFDFSPTDILTESPQLDARTEGEGDDVYWD